MVKLSDLIEGGQTIIISGPYGTEIAERVGRDTTERPQKASGVPTNKYIGAGCSALLTPEGHAYVHDVALDYLRSVPKSQPLVLVTDSFRLAKQTLEAAATVRGVNPNLPSMGLELCLDSVELATEAVEKSGRSRQNTAIAMSIGTPFDCYKGEDTPADIDNKYLPQTFAAVRFGHEVDFAAVRFGHEVDYLMFETVPSLAAAVGAAKAFKQAHEGLNIPDSKANFTKMGTITYLGDLLEKAIRFGDGAVQKLAPSYDPSTQTFSSIKPEKEYVISLCLEADSSLNGRKLNEAIDDLYRLIEKEGLYEPVGLGINCNSPEVTRNALSSLSPINKTRVIAVHANASSENNPRRYAEMTRQQAIPTLDFAGQVATLVTEYGLKIVGGCCGTGAG
ncbi:homocysteine S-methyltransferase family protein, partial [Candidatus Woesearchaeota archaeon]|nr:homocysteine S-methyltransferase family protein [Candidatus Woesearchaeota archaeon]